MWDLNEFSASIYTDLIRRFPEWENFSKSKSGLLEVDIVSQTEAQLGGLVIQTTEDNSAWIRIYLGCLAYHADDSEELIRIIEGVLDDKILWAIGYKGDQWHETTLVRSLEDIESKQGVTYRLLSWSGRLDTEKVF